MIVYRLDLYTITFRSIMLLYLTSLLFLIASGPSVQPCGTPVPRERTPVRNSWLAIHTVSCLSVQQFRDVERTA